MDLLIPQPIFTSINKDTCILDELDDALSKQRELELYTETYGYGGWLQYNGPLDPYLLVVSLSPSGRESNELEEVFSSGASGLFKEEIMKNDVPTGFYYVYPFPLVSNAEIPANHKEVHLMYFKRRMKLLKPAFIFLLGKKTWENCISFITKTKFQWRHGGINSLAFLIILCLRVSIP